MTVISLGYLIPTVWIFSTLSNLRRNSNLSLSLSLSTQQQGPQVYRKARDLPYRSVIVLDSSSCAFACHADPVIAHGGTKCLGGPLARKELISRIALGEAIIPHTCGRRIVIRGVSRAPYPPPSSPNIVNSPDPTKSLNARKLTDYDSVVKRAWHKGKRLFAAYIPLPSCLSSLSLSFYVFLSLSLSFWCRPSAA